MGRRIPRCAVLTFAATLVLAAAYATSQATLPQLWHAVVPNMPERVADQLAGRGLPPASAYVAVVLLGLALLGLLAAFLLPGKENSGRPPSTLVGVVTAIALAAGGSALGNGWSRSAADAMASASFTHTQASGPDNHYDVSIGEAPISNLELGWKAQPGEANNATFLVPGTDLALSYQTDNAAGVIAYDAETGAEKWRYLTKGRSALGGLAVSPRSSAVVVVFGDVAVGLGLDTGEVEWRTVLPSSHDDARFYVLGDLPRPWTGEHDASPVVPLFFGALVLQQRDDLGSGPAGPVVALGTDGKVTSIESSPATACGYAAWYTDLKTYLLRQSDIPGTCGLPEVSEISIGERSQLVQLPADPKACPTGCELLSARASTAGELTLFSPRDGRILRLGGTGLRSSTATADAWDTETLVLALSEFGDDVLLVQEMYNGPARATDAKGRVTATGGPLPGSPFATATTATAWYRFHSLGDNSGRVEVVDPKTLKVGAPSPAFACGHIDGMTASNGRLLVQCADKQRSVFVFTGEEKS